MCKVGDIIVVNGAKREGSDIGKHSFVVLNTQGGQIEGMDFDLVCNVMSSLEGKSEAYKKKKLGFLDNFPYNPQDEIIANGHGKEGFIKAGVLFYFDKSNLDYYVLGNITIELYNKLIQYIQELESVENVIDNLKQ